MRPIARLTFRSAFFLALPGAAAVAVACGDDATSSELGALDAGGNAPLLQDARAGNADSGPPVSTMRFAHLAPGVGPVDFCYEAARGGPAVGPVLGGGIRLDAGADADADAAPPPEPEPGDADVDAAAPSQRALYRSVTKYRNLETAGALTFSIVAAGSTSCANPLAEGAVTLDPGKLSTVALLGRQGDGGMELEVVAFTDDRKTESDKARVRVIHAALGRSGRPALGAFAASAVGASVVALASRVEPGKAAAPAIDAGLDDLGYASAAPLPDPVAFEVEPIALDSGAPAALWRSVAGPLELRGDSLHTAFVLSAHDDPGLEDEPWLEVLWCSDTTTSGDQTTCIRLR